MQTHRLRMVVILAHFAAESKCYGRKLRCGILFTTFGFGLNYLHARLELCYNYSTIMEIDMNIIINEEAADALEKLTKKVKARPKAIKNVHTLHVNWHLMTNAEKEEATKLASDLGLVRELSQGDDN